MVVAEPSKKRRSKKKKNPPQVLLVVSSSSSCSYYHIFKMILLIVLMVSTSSTWSSMIELVDGAIGANWGTQATHPLPPKTVVQMLKDNGIQKVKLFDANKDIFNALSKSGIEVMVGIPNEMLSILADDVSAAESWVSKNISKFLSSDDVDIKYVAVGNEPFLKSSNGTYVTVALPALQNIQSALIKAGLGNRVKVTIPLNADVFQSSSNLPSGGDFRTDIHDLMLKIVKFLSDGGSPFMVNIYPFISLYNDPSFPIDFAFFDTSSAPLNDDGKIYTNVFDASHDMLVWALQKNGFGNLSVVVGEIGWPTDGDINANPVNARRFNQGFVNHAAKGTPMRPGIPVDAYLFSLIDEDNKSVRPGNFERHWGVFYFDGLPKYQLNLGNNAAGIVAAKGVKYLPKKWCVMNPAANPNDPQVAPTVNYACSNADCTSLGYGTSCGNLDIKGNISYAYNSYYQQNNQLDSACKFPDSLSVITTVNPSTQTCRFQVMIESSEGTAGSRLSEPVSTLLVFVSIVLVVSL